MGDTVKQPILARFTTGKQGMCTYTCEKMSVLAAAATDIFLLVGKNPKPSFDVPAAQLRD